jgi:hypothetical protein
LSRKGVNTSEESDNYSTERKCEMSHNSDYLFCGLAQKVPVNYSIMCKATRPSTTNGHNLDFLGKAQLSYQQSCRGTPWGSPFES